MGRRHLMQYWRGSQWKHRRWAAKTAGSILCSTWHVMAGLSWQSPVLTYAGIYLSWLTVHSPVMASSGIHLSWLRLESTYHGWGCTHLSRHTMALTLHGLCWYPPVMAKGAVTCHGGQWHSPVIAYAGIHQYRLTLEFICHEKRVHSPLTCRFVQRRSPVMAESELTYHG